MYNELLPVDSLAKFTFVSMSMHFGLLAVPQWSASLPSKSSTSGFAPLRSSNSIRETAPENAALWIAVDPSDACGIVNEHSHDSNFTNMIEPRRELLFCIY